MERREWSVEVETEKRFDMFTGAPSTKTQIWIKNGPGEHDHLALVCHAARDPEQDARLLAAAPKLLKALEDAREQLRQAWACIEHLKEHAPRELRESAVATMGDVGDVGLDCDALLKELGK